MHFLITGHTGFKGAWLTLMLKQLGHTVSGVSLDPIQDSLFIKANIARELQLDIRQDITAGRPLIEVFQRINPDVVIHLAAQPLVLQSYLTPTETFRVNVMGTLNVLEATRNLSNLKAILVITTDKVYKDRNSSTPFIETDSLGGTDPYSASKAAADIVTESWSKSFSGPPVAIARAGNVIGGGDYASSRLIPELIHAYSRGLKPKLRNPSSTRPWQHVLDCLNGYLLLIESQLKSGISGPWNFGPNEYEKRNVAELVDEVAIQYGFSRNHWETEPEQIFNEQENLQINSSKSRSELGWCEKYDFKSSVKETVDWYKNIEFGKIDEFTRFQVQDFLKK